MRPVFLASALALAACTVTREPLPLPADFVLVQGEPAGTEDLRRAWLGLEVGLNESDDLMALDVRPGVRVVAVDPEGPAARAGVQVGDVLLELDGAPVNDPGRLAALLANVQTARRVALEMERGARVFLTHAVPEIRSAQAGRTLAWVERALLRVAVRDAAISAADPLGRYPEISGFGPRSPLERAGARTGDRVMTFQGRDAGSAEAFARRVGAELQPGAPVRIGLLAADGSQRELEFDAWSPGTALTELGLWPLFCWQREPDGDRGLFWIGDLLLVQLFRVNRVGREKEYSVLGLLSWSTGSAVLEEDPVLALPAGAGGP